MNCFEGATVVLYLYTEHFQVGMKPHKNKMREKTLDKVFLTYFCKEVSSSFANKKIQRIFFHKFNASNVSESHMIICELCLNPGNLL